MQKVLSSHVEGHLRLLTEDIGVRLAGSASERRAVAYILEQLRLVCPVVQVEEFKVMERAAVEQHLEVCVAGRCRAFPVPY